MPPPSLGSTEATSFVLENDEASETWDESTPMMFDGIVNEEEDQWGGYENNVAATGEADIEAIDQYSYFTISCLTLYI